MALGEYLEEYSVKLDFQQLPPFPHSANSLFVCGNSLTVLRLRQPPEVSRKCSDIGECRVIITRVRIIEATFGFQCSR